MVPCSLNISDKPHGPQKLKCLFTDPFQKKRSSFVWMISFVSTYHYLLKDKKRNQGWKYGPVGKNTDCFTMNFNP